jgi:SAM-dependent methyltransferase
MRERLTAFVVQHRVLRQIGERVSPSHREIRRTRRWLAKGFLRGQGLEIGALHLPLPLPRGTSARYVDRMSREDLRREYPELASYDLVEVDVIDDGETLATVPDTSVDFVVANHFIEHTENPIATLRNLLRVVKPGGVLFLAVPDQRYTFDRERAVTPLDHIAKDFEEGPEWSRRMHFEEWARHVEHAPDPAAHAAKLEAEDYSIHFHTFTPDAFGELLVHAKNVAGLAIAVEALVPVRHEFVAVLRHVAR